LFVCLLVCCSLKRETKMNARMIMLGTFGAFAVLMVVSVICTFCSGGVAWMDRSIEMFGAKVEYRLYPYKFCFDITGEGVEETHECKYQSAFCDDGDDDKTVTATVKRENTQLSRTAMLSSVARPAPSSSALPELLVSLVLHQPSLT